MVFAHIIGGLLLIALGVVTLKFNYQVVGFTGRQDWIESKLGAGSTYLAYKLFAIVLVLAGVLYATGLGAPVTSWLLSPLKGVFGGLKSNN